VEEEDEVDLLKFPPNGLHHVECAILILDKGNLALRILMTAQSKSTEIVLGFKSALPSLLTYLRTTSNISW
jgi:hypothetical protein